MSVCMYLKFDTIVPYAIDNQPTYHKQKINFTVDDHYQKKIFFVQTLGSVRSPSMFYIFLVNNGVGQRSTNFSPNVLRFCSTMYLTCTVVPLILECFISSANCLAEKTEFTFLFYNLRPRLLHHSDQRELESYII